MVTDIHHADQAVIPISWAILVRDFTNVLDMKGSADILLGRIERRFTLYAL